MLVKSKQEYRTGQWSFGVFLSGEFDLSWQSRSAVENQKTAGRLAPQPQNSKGSSPVFNTSRADVFYRTGIRRVPDKGGMSQAVANRTKVMGEAITMPARTFLPEIAGDAGSAARESHRLMALSAVKTKTCPRTKPSSSCRENWPPKCNLERVGCTPGHFELRRPCSPYNLTGQVIVTWRTEPGVGIRHYLRPLTPQVLSVLRDTPR
jgi:hypothetical protein